MDAQNNTNLQEQPSGGKSRIRGIFPKIVSLIAAFSIWFYAMSVESPNFQDDFNNVSVDLFGISELETTYGLSAMFGDDQAIDVVLSGKKNVMNELNVDDIYAYADVSGITEAGRYVLDVQVNAPSGITVVNHFPQTISVYLDKLTSKVIPVKTVRSSVTLDAGYSLGTIVTNVDYVTVTGPAEFINTVAAAQMTLSLGHFKRSTTITDSIVLVDTNGNVLSNAMTKIRPSSITATVPLMMTKELSLKADFLHGYFNEENSNVKITPATVTVTMPAELSESLNEIVIATVDETKIDDMTPPLQSAVILPAGVTSATEIGYATVDITLKNTKTKQFTLDAESVRLKNVPEGYEPDISTKSFTFAVRGPIDVVSELTTSDFTVSADMQGDVIEGYASIALDISCSVSGTYILNTEDHPVPTVLVQLEKIQ